MARHSILLVAALSLVACATLSPRKSVENRFVEFGLSEDRAKCLASELDERLDRGDLEDVAEFVGGLNAAASPGEGLDALLRIDNPRAAGAIARAGIACAFSRG